MPQKSSSTRSGFSKLELLISIGVILILAALIFPAIQRAREAAHRTQARNNLKQLALACHNYHDVYTTLPLGGTVDEGGLAIHGWLTRLRPYLDASPHYSWIIQNRPWDDPLNQYVMTLPVWGTQMPGVEQVATEERFAVTHVMGNPAVFHRNTSVGLDEFENGTAHSWLMGEVAGQFEPAGSPFNWRAWESPLNTGPESYGRPSGKGAYFVMADGSVPFIANEVSEEVRRTIAGGLPEPTTKMVEKPDRTYTLRTEFPPRTFETLVPTSDFDDGWGLQIYKEWNGHAQTAVICGISKRPPSRQLTPSQIDRLVECCPEVSIVVIHGSLSEAACDPLMKLTRLERLRISEGVVPPASINNLDSATSLHEVVLE